MNEITISKGSYTVTIYSTVNGIADNFSKQIRYVPSIQTQDNQENGPKEIKALDLLSVTHQIVIKGYITGTDTKSAIDVKRDLVNIWKGAGLNGGETTLSYDGNAKALGNVSSTATSSIVGYLEKISFIDGATDEPDDVITNKENYTDMAKFEVSITFVESNKI